VHRGVVKRSDLHLASSFRHNPHTHGTILLCFNTQTLHLGGAGGLSLLFDHLSSSLLGGSTSITTRSSRSVQKQVSASSLRNFPTLPFGEISSSVHSLRWIRVIMSVSSSRLSFSSFHLYSIIWFPPRPENHRGSTSLVRQSSSRTPCM